MKVDAIFTVGHKLLLNPVSVLILFQSLQIEDFDTLVSDSMDPLMCRI